MSSSRIRITLSEIAEKSIERILDRVNNGFNGGRISRNDLLSWLAIYFEEHLLESMFEKVRKDHFDQLTYLESIVREIRAARKNGNENPDLTTLLAPIQSSIRSTQKRKEQNNV